MTQCIAHTILEHTFEPDCAACLASTVSICRTADARSLERMRALARSVHVPKGSTLTYQDEISDNLFFVSSGMIKLYQILEGGRRQITGFLGPGDILGGLRRENGARCTAETITEVTACAFPRNEFMAVVHRTPELALQLLLAATDEIEAEYDHIVLLGRKKPLERLAVFLLILQHRWKRDEDIQNEVFLPMTRADIAEYLGLTVETVSRTISRLKKLGYITIPNRNSALLNNLPALYDLAGLRNPPVRHISLGF